MQLSGGRTEISLYEEISVFLCLIVCIYFEKGVNLVSDLKRTPIYPEYAKLGARTIDFGGWDLPVQFSSIKHEHEVTRTKATIFDVSHMGQIIVSGKKSLPFLQYVLTNDLSKLKVNRAQYTFMCYEDGGTVDDFLVYKLTEDEYMLVVNAANTSKDYKWLKKNNKYGTDVNIQDVTADYAIIALQGPKAEKVLQSVIEINVEEIAFFGFDQHVNFKELAADALISRTGYTGEDGFEIYIAANKARDLWNLLLTAGKEDGLVPAGLGARDTLRFEVGLPLYGQELSKDITPIEAGFNFAVKINKEIKFIGQDVLEKQMINGPERTLVGIEMIDRGIPRTGYDVLKDDEIIGKITSGTQSPTLNKSLGFALIDEKYAKIGTELVVQVRRRQVKAKVVITPFLKK